MAPERITVTVTSSIGEGAPLTVDDAMRQILDLFGLLTAAGGDQSSNVAWQLVAVSMRSPLSATAEAVPTVAGIQAEPIARREKALLADSLENIVVRAEVPEWMDAPTREKARSLFARNTNGIGRTDITFYDEAPIVSIGQTQANSAIAAFDQARERAQPQSDLSRIEMGSIEANVLFAGPYRGQPAIQVRDRLSGIEFWCVFAAELAETIGVEHSWAETWTHRRVLLTGQISYARNGNIRSLYAAHIEDIDTQPIIYEDFADPEFTGGLGTVEYIKSLWEEEVD